MPSQLQIRVGEVRPSQLMFAYGIGAIVDLPKLSVIVTGLEDWPTDRPWVTEIVEERLLAAIRFQAPSVERLLSAPIVGRTTAVFGTASLSDNRGNVGLLKIAPDGTITGTVTRGSDIVGRFEGTLREGMEFVQYSV